MSLVTPQLRLTGRGYAHWCPGCLEMHILFEDGWTRTGTLEKPSYAPSYRHSGKQTVKDATGRWTGGWVRDPETGRALDSCCHYVLTNGVLNFQNDCTHAMKGQSIPLPVIPENAEDVG